MPLTPTVTRLSLLFAALSLADTFAPPGPHLWLKPLLIPVLAALLYAGRRFPGGVLPVYIALFCSWVGDVLLLFESQHPLFFIAGLSAFLLAHIHYIRWFLRLPRHERSLLRHQPWMAALAVAYGISLVRFLWPGLGEMKLPVSLYTVVICGMVISSLLAYNRVPRRAGRLLVTGAMLFTVSDSLLALDKFHQPFTGAGAAIMLTYCAAQWCIVYGALCSGEPLSNPAAGDES